MPMTDKNSLVQHCFVGLVLFNLCISHQYSHQIASLRSVIELLMIDINSYARIRSEGIVSFYCDTAASCRFGKKSRTKRW